MKVLYEQSAKGSFQEQIVLERIVLEDGILTAEIPVELKQMPEDMIEAFYPYEGRPERIYADADGKSQMTFQLIDKKLTPDEVGKAAEAVREYISQIYPRNELCPVHLCQEERFLMGWFAMGLEEAGIKQRHIKAVISVRNQMFLTTVTFLEEEQLKWEVLFRHFFHTLKETS